MNIIAVVNNKGGVGKTTSVQNIGACIAHITNTKVLLIDLDPQGSLTKSLGINKGIINGTGDWLLNSVSFNEIKQSYNSNIDILPTSQKLIEQEIQIMNSASYPFNLKFSLKKLNDSYDFVVIDCPPSLGALTRVALLSCNTYLIPMQPEYFSYEGLRSIILYINELALINENMSLGGVFATRFNPNFKKNFSIFIMNSIKDQIGDQLLNTFIRENISLSEAQAKGKTILDYRIDSNAATDYLSLTKEILNKAFNYNEQ